jgi:hypothetical protein
MWVMLPITNVANYQLDIGHWHWQHWILATFQPVSGRDKRGRSRRET